LIGSRLAHYEILEKIGAGGMGEVYRARDTKLGRDVALKILPKEMSNDPERRKRFQREATAVAALKHPNIVTIFSVEEAEGRHFLTMELVEGKTVSQLLPPDGFPLEQYFKIAIPLAEAINSAHVAGITHRDLKPANVMLDADGRVKVLDFGLAKLLEPTDQDVEEAETLVDNSDTQEGRVLGTVAYMSPEQAEGKTVDARSDIFSLGILLYEMATGKRPFTGDSSLSLLSSILKDTPSSVSDLRGHLPVQLGRIVQHCLEKDPRKRFQSALDVANEIEALKLEVSSATGSVEAIRAPKKPLLSAKVRIGAAIAIVALVTLLIINPFKVEVSSDQDASAAGNTLAIMYFENLAEPDDPKRYGEIVAELLITGLSESDHISVVSSQRLYDLLKQLGKEGVKQIDRTTASDVAKRAEARWMMQGRILQAEPSYVITSQIVEVSTGNVAASQRTTGQPGENIFALVDRITEETLKDLSVPDAGAESTTPSVASISTASEEAYRYYLEGIENERKFFSQEAREAYRKALEVDSTFAMAAYHLGATRGNARETRAYLRQAIRHADKTSKKEQLYIASIKYWLVADPPGYVSALNDILKKYPDDKHTLERLQSFYSQTGDSKRALEYCERLIEIDPMDKGTYNQMAYMYNAEKHFDKALWALGKYIELAPGEPNPYDSRGDIYARNGNIDEAIASYTKAIEIKPDFADYGSVIKLGDMYACKGEYDKAQGQYRRLFASGDARIRSRGRSDLIQLLTHRGLLDDALEQIDAAMRVDEVEDLGVDVKMERLFGKAVVQKEVLDPTSAIATAREAVRLRSPSDDFERMELAIRLAGVGDADRAEEYLAPLKNSTDTLEGIKLIFYNMVLGAIEGARGNNEAAVEHMEQSAATVDWWWVRFPLGATYIKSERWQDAIGTLEPLLSSYQNERIDWGVEGVRLHYYLGVAYQETGRNADAIEQLEQFLSILKDGDPRIKGIDDARQRLAVLKQGS